MNRESPVTGSRWPEEPSREARAQGESQRPRRESESPVPFAMANEAGEKRRPDEAHSGLPVPNEDAEKQPRAESNTDRPELEVVREQLRQALLALEAAEARYQDIYGEAPVAFLTVGVQGKILSANRAAARLLGMPLAASPRRRITEFMAPGDAARFNAHFMALFPKRKPVTFELEMGRGDGSTFWAELTMGLAVDDGANVCRVVLTDQSARKKMQEGAAQLAAIVTQAGQAIISEDSEGNITTWNAGAERLFGYSSLQTIGFSIEMIVPADHLAEDRMLRAQVRRGNLVAQESLRLREDGSLVPVFISAAPIREASGRVVGVSYIVRDISEQIADRNEVTRLLEDLRTADRRKDDFIATLAHELRNPLAPIRNAAAVMRFVGDLDPKLQWCRDVIDRQVGHMAALLEDLLDISRLTRDVIKLRRDRVELGTAIAQAIEINRPLIDSRGHSLTVHLATEPIEVEGDLTRLTQIFGNLLNNAAKYTEPNGQISVTVEPSGTDVVIRIRDNGIGIKQENLAGIFDLFSQVDPMREGHEGGLGIGLALVKGLVERHRGAIEAQSAGVGQGAEFVITLPVARLTQPHITNEEGPRTRRAGHVGRSLRVLVVDDNVDAAESMAVMLRSSHHHIHTANDGQTAIEMSGEIRPDVLLLDLGMPKMSGYEVASRLRQEPWGRDIFLVACTGWGQPEDRRRSRDAGFDYHLVKPVSVDAVLQLLDDVAGGESG